MTGFGICSASRAKSAVDRGVRALADSLLCTGRIQRVCASNALLMTWWLGDLHLASARWSDKPVIVFIRGQLHGDCSYHPAVSTNGDWHTDTELRSVAKLGEFRPNRALFSFYYHWSATNKYDSTTHRLCEAVKCEYTLHRFQWKLTFVTKRLTEHVIRGGMRNLVTSCRSGCAILS
jgi:hypothetical protein